MFDSLSLHKGWK